MTSTPWGSIMVKLSSIEGGLPPKPPAPPPPQEPTTVVDFLKSLIEKAERGDLVEYVALYVDDAGNIESSFFLTRKTSEMSMRAFIDFEGFAEHSKTDVGGPA